MKQAKGLVHTTTHTMIQIIQFRFQKVYVKRVTHRFVEYILQRQSKRCYQIIHYSHISAQDRTQKDLAHARALA
jgi:hypothetical protein